MFPHRFHKPKGFTLVEILTVVVILGIASAVIIPQIGSRDDLVASAAARLVMADLIYAQNRSIAVQKRHFVQFVGQQYGLMTRDNDAVSTLTVISHPVSKNAYAATFGSAQSGLDRVSLVSTSHAIIGFDELGSPFSFDAATNTITTLTSAATIVVRAGSIDLTISIEPYTGEVTVQ